MEYKFRGKRIDNEEWVYGSYHYCTQDGTMRYVDYKDGNRVVDDKPVTFNCHWILEHKTPDTSGWDVRDSFVPHEVIPETVGQFTGLKDANSVDIYEGDILKSFSPSVPSYEVFYSRSSYRLRYKLKNGEWYDWGPLFRMVEIQWEGRLPLCPDVIGNIRDNPELLNPAQGNGPLNTMHNFDPKEGQAEQEGAGAAADAEAENEQATEIERASEVTGQAAENAEEVTEG